MKLLTFQASRFAWKPHERTLEDAAEAPPAGEMRDAVVAFLHAESKDEEPKERARVFRHVLKHVKWIAGKRGWKRVVLHSFTHLGAENASPGFAEELLGELAQRLRETGYEVRLTPFGWFCSWDLSVLGDSLAKVWKQV